MLLPLNEKRPLIFEDNRRLPWKPNRYEQWGVVAARVVRPTNVIGTRNRRSWQRNLWNHFLLFVFSFFLKKKLPEMESYRWIRPRSLFSNKTSNYKGNWKLENFEKKTSLFLSFRERHRKHTHTYGTDSKKKIFPKKENLTRLWIRTPWVFYLIIDQDQVILFDTKNKSRYWPGVRAGLAWADLKNFLERPTRLASAGHIDFYPIPVQPFTQVILKKLNINKFYFYLIKKSIIPYLKID